MVVRPRKLRQRARTAKEMAASAKERTENEDEIMDLEVSPEEAVRQNWIVRPVECLTSREDQCAKSWLPQVGNALMHRNYVKMNFEYFLRLCVRKNGED